MWNLQAAGRGFAVMGQIAERAGLAYQEVGAARQALAEQNFTESERSFGIAHALLQEAQGDLTAALQASQIVLETADLSGTVRSGNRLLEAGERITLAGQHMTRGLQPLLDARVLGEGSSSEQPTAVSALRAATAEFVPAHEALAEAAAALEDVNPAVLPAELRAPVEELQKVTPKLTRALGIFLEQSDFLLTILGADRDRQYLLLFQNNHELRPTGGFIGSLALINVAHGVVEDIDVQTVYDGDGQLKEFIAPPEPLRAISNRWYLRDANWFADFAVSAPKIAGFFEKEGGPTVDGVIALTPEVIKRLLVLTGPIEVPGYEATITSENFVELTQQEVTYDYDKELNRPKQFLADLTPLLLNRLFAAEASSALHVAEVLAGLLEEKHILLHLSADDEQRQVERAGLGGSFPADEPAFLSVNTANIGGHKSDQFVEQEIDYRLQIDARGQQEATVTIRRTHHGPTEALPYEYPEGENPAFKDNVVYQRVFVPPGAQLLEARGFTPANEVPRTVLPEPDVQVVPDLEVTEWQRAQHQHGNGTAQGVEAGYAYFGNWLITKPGATTVALYRYVLPEPQALPSFLWSAQALRVFVAHQPGDVRTAIRAEIRLPDTYRVAHTVPHDGITQPTPHELVYRGALRRDLLLGAVVTK